ncbi:histone deacetylase family protein [Desulfatirhabdium butyrativorans]|uniref:histone deacetylase family protein n=1 Tax=Desulfatirhabdium butyrativorans TaxID=340467 RepID=UPI00040E8E0C|nr:histone deacetylase [Desulfatirhabdium butyrativorans]
MAELIVFHDERFSYHDPGEGHPENAGRIVAAKKALDAFGGGLRIDPGRMIDPVDLERLHSPAYIRFVKESARKERSSLSSDTFASSATYETALLAAGTAQAAVEAVLQGSCRRSFALVRPPGHHAEFGRSMGYCVFSNTALAAEFAMRRFGLQRILIVDWDVHHGNGTQHLFEADPRVVFFSVHQSPLFPGTGHVTEVGRGRGEGYTVNVPLPKGCTDADYAMVFERILCPLAEACRPELILISAGFDAHADDPMAGMRVSAAGFSEMTRSVMAMAQALCGGRLALILEGGYHPDALTESLAAVLRRLGDSDISALPPARTAQPSSAFLHLWKRFRSVHQQFWRCFTQ